MGILNKISEAIISWIGPVGLFLILLIIILVWTLYYFVVKNPLDFKEVIGLVVLSFVVVGLGNLVFKMFKKEKGKDSQKAKGK